VGPSLNKTGDLVTQDTEKAFFASVFTSKMDLQESQVPETKGKCWNNEDLHVVEENQVRKYFSKQDIHKFIDPDGSMMGCTHEC